MPCIALEMADQYEDIEAASCYYADPGAGWKFLQLLLPRKWLHLRKVLILRTWQRLLEKTILILLGCLHVIGWYQHLDTNPFKRTVVNTENI